MRIFYLLTSDFTDLSNFNNTNSSYTSYNNIESLSNDFVKSSKGY